jgi:hypothetical protein
LFNWPCGQNPGRKPEACRRARPLWSASRCLACANMLSPDWAFFSLTITCAREGPFASRPTDGPPALHGLGGAHSTWARPPRVDVRSCRRLLEPRQVVRGVAVVPASCGSRVGDSTGEPHRGRTHFQGPCGGVERSSLGCSPCRSRWRLPGAGPQAWPSGSLLQLRSRGWPGSFSGQRSSSKLAAATTSASYAAAAARPDKRQRHPPGGSRPHHRSASRSARNRECNSACRGSAHPR